MNNLTKLHLALIQVDNVIRLLQNNEYESYMYRQLYIVKFELERQISNLTNAKQSSKIKE